MRITTLGALSILSATLTSAVVWAATSPDIEPGDTPALVSSSPEPAAAEPPAEPPAEAPVDAAPSPALPAIDANFLISGPVLLEGRLGHAQLPAGAANRTYLYLEARGDAASLAPDIDARPAPINLALVIDRSGSMEGRRQRNARAAAAKLIGKLRDGDTVSVVTYSDRASVLIPATTIDVQTRGEILAAVERRLRQPPRGATCISCGIDRALSTLEDRPNTRGPGVDRILLLSDGEANRGKQRITSMSKLARKAQLRGVSISSVGVDVDYDARLMSALARASNGHHYYAPTSANLDEHFDAEFEELLGTVATNAELVIEPAPGVRITQVFDRTFEQDGERVVVSLGNVAADDPKPVLLELELADGSPGELPVATVSLRYADLTGSTPRGRIERRDELALRLGPPRSAPAPLDPIVLAHLTTSETASTLATANELFARGQNDAAQQVLDAHLSAVNARAGQIATTPDPGHLHRDLDDSLRDQVELLEGSKHDFGEAAAMPTQARRKQAKNRMKLNLAGSDAPLGF